MTQGVGSCETERHVGASQKLRPSTILTNNCVKFFLLKTKYFNLSFKSSEVYTFLYVIITYEMC